MSANDRTRQLGLDLLEITGGVPVSEPTIMSPFDPPYNIMENYSCEQIRTYGGGGYGFGTMHKIPGGYATALHVTRIDQLDLVQTVRDLEEKYGMSCVRFENTDLHLFGVTTRPIVNIPKMESGTPLTIVGCPAGSTFPEIYHVEYYLDNPDIRGHWVQSVPMMGVDFPKAIVGGNSGGGVYLGHLTHSELKDAQSIGHVRAEGSIFDSIVNRYNHFAIISFYND